MFDHDLFYACKITKQDTQSHEHVPVWGNILSLSHLRVLFNLLNENQMQLRNAFLGTSVQHYAQSTS